jgi:hypothetical protein
MIVAESGDATPFKFGQIRLSNVTLGGASVTTGRFMPVFSARDRHTLRFGALFKVTIGKM